MPNTDNVKDAGAAVKTPDDYDETYKKHFEIAERAKTEYEQLYKEMVENLSTAHFDPLETVLIEREKQTIADKEAVISKLKEKMLYKFLDSLNNSWEACDISNRLATLAMLKERCKEYEGQNWHIHDMPPKQRLLPLRIRYKENSKRYLQKQLQHQNLQLEGLIKINTMQRACVQEVTNQRVYLKEAMERETKELVEKKQILQQLQKEMLTEPEDDW